MFVTHSGYNYHTENQLPNYTKFAEHYSLKFASILKKEKDKINDTTQKNFFFFTLITDYVKSKKYQVANSKCLENSISNFCIYSFLCDCFF